MPAEDQAPPTTVAAEAAAAMMDFMSALSPIIEALGGYRTQLLEVGLDAVAADAMCVDLHRGLIAGVFTAMGKGK